jgi:hypothetical protein
MKDWLLEHIPESLTAAFFAVIGWWVQRKIARSEALEVRIQALERDKATKTDIDDLREHIDASITRSLARVETRTDEILLHLARRDMR